MVKSIERVKEGQFQTLHKIDPCTAFLSKFMDIENKCSFCDVEEDLDRLFYSQDVSYLCFYLLQEMLIIIS